MCLAIYKPGDIIIPDQTLHKGWISNPDGAGFAYIKKGKVVKENGFMNYKDFIAAYGKAQGKHGNSPFLIHFRIRSMGDKNPENTHPFEIPGGMLIHNGTITGTAAVHSVGMSDTFFFAKKYGDKMTYENLRNNKEKWEQAITWNKIAILYDDGNYIILNESKGDWVEGAWYSNLNHNYNAPRGGGRRDVSQMDDDERYRMAYGMLD